MCTVAKLRCLSSPVERALVYKDDSFFAKYITEEVEIIYLKEKDPKKRGKDKSFSNKLSLHSVF